MIYRDSYQQYLEAGFKPIPVTGKFPPISGATGHRDPITAEEVEEWANQHPAHQIAIRAEGWVAIDVDDGYGDKDGAAQLAALVDQWGPLPATWTSTARGEGPSRQYLFQVPEGQKFATKPAPAIEMIQWSHRYTVCAPSVHPDTGTPYRWYAPSGGMSFSVPQLAELPHLPARWLAGLARIDTYTQQDRETLDAEDFLGEFVTGDPCRECQAFTSAWQNEKHIGHDEFKRYSLRGMMLGREGHVGVAESLGELSSLYMEYLTKTRPFSAGREFASLLNFSAEQAQKRDVTGVCRCTPATALGGTSDWDLAELWGLDYGSESYRYLTDEEQWGVFVDGAWDFLSGRTYQAVSVAKMFRDLERQGIKANLGSKGKLDAVVGLCRLQEGLLKRRDDFDVDPWRLAVGNGTLDLKTGELHPSRAGDMLSQRTPVNYVPGAPRPLFEAFLSWALPDPEVRTFVQQVFGQALVGQVFEHILPVFTGSGGNGKGTLIRAVATALGPQLVVAGSRKLLIESKSAEHDTIYATLHKKRLVLIEETARDAKLSTAVTKQLTGGDMITAHYMGKNEFSFKPTHTIIMITNNKPAVEEDEEAVWRRMRVIDFRAKVEVPDKFLDDKLASEAEGILAWVVEGCRDWDRNGGLSEPVSVSASTAEYHVAQDPLMQFLSEEVEVTGKDGDRLDKKGLHDRYTAWCRDARPGEPVYNMVNFGAQVTKRNSLRWEASRNGKHRTSQLVGVKWRSDSDSAETKSLSQSLSHSLIRHNDSDDSDDSDFSVSSQKSSTPPSAGSGAGTENEQITVITVTNDLSPQATLCDSDFGKDHGHCHTEDATVIDPPVKGWLEVTVCYPAEGGYSL